MKRQNLIKLAGLAAIVIGGLFARHLIADETNENAIKQVMKTCHKAPEGVDPICKKAINGKATPEEIKQLVAGYKILVTAKPPKGDEASWKDKTGKLLTAAQALEKGEANAITKYKEALNCKACHTEHKPD